MWADPSRVQKSIGACNRPQGWPLPFSLPLPLGPEINVSSAGESSLRNQRRTNTNPCTPQGRCQWRRSLPAANFRNESTRVGVNIHTLAGAEQSGDGGEDAGVYGVICCLNGADHGRKDFAKRNPTICQHRGGPARTHQRSRWGEWIACSVWEDVLPTSLRMATGARAPLASTMSFPPPLDIVCNFLKTVLWHTGVPRTLVPQRERQDRALHGLQQQLETTLQLVFKTADTLGKHCNRDPCCHVPQLQDRHGKTPMSSGDAT